MRFYFVYFFAQQQNLNLLSSLKSAWLAVDIENVAQVIFVLDGQSLLISVSFSTITLKLNASCLGTSLT